MLNCWYITWPAGFKRVHSDTVNNFFTFHRRYRTNFTRQSSDWWRNEWPWPNHGIERAQAQDAVCQMYHTWLVSHEEWQITSQCLMFTVPQLFRDSFDVMEPTCLRRNNKGYFAGVWKGNALGIFETRPYEKKNTTQLSDLVSVQYLQSRQRSTANIERGGTRQSIEFGRKHWKVATWHAESMG
jgi:hypothetical protein